MRPTACSRAARSHPRQGSRPSSQRPGRRIGSAGRPRLALLGCFWSASAGGRALTVGSNPTAGKRPQQNKSRGRPDLPETLAQLYSSLPVCHARASERRTWRPGEVGSAAAPPDGPLAGARAQPSGSAPPSSGLVVVPGLCAGSAPHAGEPTAAEEVSPLPPSGRVLDSAGRFS